MYPGVYTLSGGSKRSAPLCLRRIPHRRRLETPSGFPGYRPAASGGTLLRPPFHAQEQPIPKDIRALRALACFATPLAPQRNAVPATLRSRN